MASGPIRNRAAGSAASLSKDRAGAALPSLGGLVADINVIMS